MERNARDDFGYFVFVKWLRTFPALGKNVIYGPYSAWRFFVHYRFL